MNESDADIIIWGDLLYMTRVYLLLIKTRVIKSSHRIISKVIQCSDSTLLIFMLCLISNNSQIPRLAYI